MQKYLCLLKRKKEFIFMPRNKYDVNFRKQCLIEKQDKRYLSYQYISIKNNYELLQNACFENDGKNIDRIVRTIKSIRNEIKKDSKLDCGARLVESRYKKRKRIENHVKRLILNNKAIFVTLTFNNETLEKYDSKKRRRLIQRYLKSNCKEYVANIDFGEDNGREHYHAIVSNDINLKQYKLGAINVEHIRASQKSIEKTSKYINKLTSHALKEYSIDTRLIFSRKVIE